MHEKVCAETSKVWEQCHLSIGFIRNLPVFCHSQGQAMVLNKCAHKGLCLATYTHKCKTNHSNPWNQLFFFQIQINLHWTGFTSCGVQCTQPPTPK